MCAHRTASTRSVPAAIAAALRKLTFDDLRAWAGDTILSRGQGYVDRVAGLSVIAEGALAAWVSGSERYATSVRIHDGKRLEYTCTCPYDGGPCKHAVAVVLAAAGAVKNDTAVPVLAQDDELSRALAGGMDDDRDEDWEDEPQPAPGRTRTGPRDRVQEMLAGKSPEQLRELLAELAGRYPEVERHILESEMLAKGRADQIVRALRKQIARVTAEPGWYDPWRGEGSLPDYTPVADRLQALLDQGHADAVLALGEELWTRGNEQVGQSNDEGETGTALARCMEIVLQALPRSSLPRPAQLLWVIDRLLEDEYSLLDSAGSLLEQGIYTQAHWREVAQVLEERLEAIPRPAKADFFARYPRSRLLRELLDAYTQAGWQTRIIPRLEAEADASGCYETLVDALLAGGEQERARDWCIEGYVRMAEEAPGIAAGLQRRLREMAQASGRYDLAAAYRAQDFFRGPSRASYDELRRAAEQAQCWPAVRAAALRYLETGERPQGADWPLPAPEVEPPPARRDLPDRFPQLDTLIDIAILEQRLADVVALYRRLSQTRRWSRETDKRVAAAVADSHPQIALDIWRTIAEELIALTKPKAYEEAAGYLRHMRTVYEKQQRLDEWKALLDGIRQKHKAKRRLLEVLDRLSNKGIAG